MRPRAATAATANPGTVRGGRGKVRDVAKCLQNVFFKPHGLSLACGASARCGSAPRGGRRRAGGWCVSTMRTPRTASPAAVGPSSTSARAPRRRAWAHQAHGARTGAAAQRATRRASRDRARREAAAECHACAWCTSLWRPFDRTLRTCRGAVGQTQGRSPQIASLGRCKPPTPRKRHTSTHSVQQCAPAPALPRSRPRHARHRLQ